MGVGMGHAPSDRAAADGADEQVCTRLVVPARDCHGLLRKPRNDKWESDIRVIARRAQARRGNLYVADERVGAHSAVPAHGTPSRRPTGRVRQTARRARPVLAGARHTDSNGCPHAGG